MENDQLNGATPSYWNSVLIAGIITAIVYSALGILSSYMMLKSSSASQALGIFVCLISSMAGVIDSGQGRVPPNYQHFRVPVGGG